MKGLMTIESIFKEFNLKLEKLAKARSDGALRNGNYRNQWFEQSNSDDRIDSVEADKFFD